MYAALFEMDSWLGSMQYIITGHCAAELLDSFEEVQNLHCLLRNGRAVEKKKGQQALDVLEGILEKHYNGELTIEDIQSLDIEIKLGAIRCVTVVDGDDQIAKLCEQYPSAHVKSC